MISHRDFLTANPALSGPVFVLSGSMPAGYGIILENLDEVPFVYKFQSSPDNTTWTDQQLLNSSGTLSTSFSIDPGSSHTLKVVPANTYLRLVGQGNGGTLVVSISYRVSTPVDGTLISITQ